MKIVTSQVVFKDNGDRGAMAGQLEGSDVWTMLFSWDTSRLSFDAEEVVGYTVQEAQDRARAKAALLMQEDAVFVFTNEKES